MTAPLPSWPPQPIQPPRHSKDGRDRFYEWWVHYRSSVKRTAIFAIILILFGMVVTKPPHPISDACKDTQFAITKPVDVNLDGFIDCRSDQELGRIK